MAIEALRATRLFAAATDEQLATLAGACTPVEVRTGDVLCTEGVDAPRSFVIVDGWPDPSTPDPLI